MTTNKQRNKLNVYRTQDILFYEMPNLKIILGDLLGESSGEQLAVFLVNLVGHFDYLVEWSLKIELSVQNILKKKNRIIYHTPILRLKNNHKMFVSVKKEINLNKLVL